MFTIGRNTSNHDAKKTSFTENKLMKLSTSLMLATSLHIKPARFAQIYASDKAAELMYERAAPIFNLDNSRSSLGVLFTEERDNVIMGGIMYDAEPEFFPGLTVSFGGKVLVALLGIENQDVFAIAANVEAAYQLPLRMFPVNLSAAVGYAPDVLSFGQADRIIDWNVRAGLQLTSQIEGFLGFRFLQFDTRPGDAELDDQFHLGIRWTFAN